MAEDLAFSSGIMLRVGKTEEIERQFNEGYLRFGCAANWIMYANSQPPGIADMFEAIFAHINKDDPRLLEECHHDEINLAFSYLYEEGPNDTIYGVPEKSASFQGGEQAMYKFIQENLSYPKLARENEVTAKIMIEFTIEKDGTLSDIKVLKNDARTNLEIKDTEEVNTSKTTVTAAKKEEETPTITRAKLEEAHKSLEDEAIRVMKLTSGKWIPAENKGEKVRSYWRIPLVFRLN